MPEIKDVRHELPRDKTRIRKVKDISRIVIHHDAGSPPDTAAKELSRLKAYNKMHAKNGWGGISYHYAVGKGGQIYKCNNLSTKTAHAPGSNTLGIGLMLMGDFTGAAPPKVQLEATKWLVGELRSKMPLIKEVIAHRDSVGSSTACPGNKFTKQLISGLK